MKQMVFKATSVALCLCAVMSLAAGCSQGTSGSSASPSAAPSTASASVSSATEASTATSASGNIVIGVLEKNLSDPFQQKLNNATDEALKKLKSEGKISDFLDLNGNSDVQTQLNQADDLIAKKVSAIVMAPQDANGCSPIVTSCKTANIPIVIVNSQTNNVDQATAFVGSNDETAGQMMGDFVVSKLGGKGSAKGNVVQLEGAIGNSAQIGRNKGITSTLFAESGVKKLASLTAEWQRDKAMNITQDWLQKYSQIDAIVAENDDMAMGAVNAVKNANRSGITIVGCDAISDALNAIKAGSMTATLFQDAAGQGSTAIDVAYKIATGASYEKTTMIPFQLITKDNVDKYLSK